jgi:hypothetical protein
MDKKIFILLLLVSILLVILFINGEYEKMNGKKEIKKLNLTDYQVYITQHGGTEKTF